MKESDVTARNEIIMRLRGRTSSGGDNIAARKEGKHHAGNVMRDGGNLGGQRRSRPGPFLFKHLPCRKLPLAEQLLGARSHGKTEQQGEVGGTVNVERDSGKIGVVEHD